MKRFLILYFLLSIKLTPLEQEIKYYFELPLNPKCEAMGSTGMVYGEEYGSLYLAPTSLLERKLRKYDNVDIRGSAEIATSFRDDVFFHTSLRLYNFLLGMFANYKTLENNKKFDENIELIAPLLNIPLQYSIEFDEFSFGLGLTYNYHIYEYDLNEIPYIYSLHLLSLGFSSMYKSIYGNLSIALNNFLCTWYRDKIPLKDSYYENTNYLKKNLRVGYGKEFNISYLFNRIQLAVEFDNLLMKGIYLNNDEKDYALFRKFHLGICAIKEMKNNILELRIGIKNLFPTFGIELNVRDTFKIAYTFTNIDLGQNWGEKRELINVLSVNISFSEYYRN